MVTRRAFFSSSRFFTCQRCERQAGGFATTLFVIVMSDGTRLAIVGIGAAEDDVLAGRLQVVVGDRERPRPVPSGDRLRVLGDRLDVRDVRSGHRCRCAVEGDAALLTRRRIAVDVAPSTTRSCGTCASAVWAAGAVSERHDVAGAAGVGLEFDEHDPPVVSALRRLQRRQAVRRSQLREAGRLGRRDAGALGRQAVAFGFERDERRPGLSSAA